MRAIVGAAFLLAACSAPAQFILPGKLDLPVAPADRIKLCADDGLKDTTPDVDCVLGAEKDPIAPYAKALKGMGWVQSEAEAGREVWTLGEGAACKRVVIDGAREEFARKRYTLLRFEVGACGLGPSPRLPL